jgi:cyclophilin family peptidyl-prolyl cis-trans isomerase
MCINPQQIYRAAVASSVGTFTITLDPRVAPQAVNSFVVLARYHYFDGTGFHPVNPGYLLQGGNGDAAPDGRNLVGYSLPDEFAGSTADFTDWSALLAAQGPGTTGSQFWIVLPGGGARMRSADYPRIGSVTAGRDIVAKISERTMNEPNHDLRPFITSVTISEA